MDSSYSSLLERTRYPQPSLQRFAVISIFEKLRSVPPTLGYDSGPERDVISQCLRSTSPAVVDQSVRELCRLVKDSKFDLSRGLLELQSALEGCDSRFVDVFVKGLGFLVRHGFQKNSSSFRFYSSETHPFVKVLSCRREVQPELVQQVLLFMAQNKQLGIVKVCDFLRPFLNFSIIRLSFSGSLSTFMNDLISSMASMCCSFPLEAMPVLKFLAGSLKYFPGKNSDEFSNISYSVEYILGVYVVVLTHLVGMRSLVHEAQLCGVELVETVVSLSPDCHKCYGGVQPIVEVIKRVVHAQKELGLSYIPELSTVTLSLFTTLLQSELEHEQLSILKLLHFLLKWKNENGHVAAINLREELLFIFPVINLVSSPSKSIKQEASDILSMLESPLVNLLVASKKEMHMPGKFPSISRPETISFRLLQYLWTQLDNFWRKRPKWPANFLILGPEILNVAMKLLEFAACILIDIVGRHETLEDKPWLPSFYFLNFAFNDGSNAKNMLSVPKTWMSMLREHALSIVERRKSSLPISRSQETFLAEMPLLLSAIASILVMHGTMGSSAVDFLAVVGIMDPKLGVPLLLAILFYNNIFSGKYKDINFHNMLIKLMGILPSLASHSAMIPLIIQTILPMLQKDAKPVLYATATRLLCKTWDINDRVFGTLQGVLHPQGFTKFMSERSICVSMAASVRDVCRKNPDRGVDLILSVSACIESQDPVVQALGFQSLSHLCEADAIDFYTAWAVICQHVLNSSKDPHVAYSTCLLLRWGAMDANAYPEASRTVLQILWDVGTSGHHGQESVWAKARVAAFDALTHYEELEIQKSIPDFKKKNMELFTSETDPEVLRAMEAFEVKIMTYEHTTRRRFVKEKRVAGSKIEKLLEVFPRAIFASGNVDGARKLPGAALFCLSLAPKEVIKGYQNVQGLQEVHAKYENALVEISMSLHLSRNILIALLSLQSWKPFMQRWFRACAIFLDGKAPSTVADKTSKAANGILKIVRKLAEESIPRSAENIALAIGALCEVLPPSAHAVKSTASKFLHEWLFQFEHEHRQWSAAISLGLVSSCLHVTDHRQKFHNIKALIEVASCSKSTLVKGACGVGLGFFCQDLLMKVEVSDDSELEKESYKMQEVDYLGKIVRALCQMICQFSPLSDLLESLSTNFPLASDAIDSYIAYESLDKNYDEMEEDIWGVAGLVLGLVSTVGALYRAGAYEVVRKIKAFIISQIPYSNPLPDNCFRSGSSDVMLSVGSCLSLPYLVAFCQRVELMHDNELNHLMSIFRELISELVSVKKSGIFHQSLLMASSVGAGNTLACILNEGVHPLEAELVKDLLALFQKAYTNPHPPLIHFGGMLGVVNALGAGAGTYVHNYPKTTLHTTYNQKESLLIIGPLLSSPVMGPQLTSLIQAMFLVAQNTDDHQLQEYAAWAFSFLRYSLWSREFQNVESHSTSDAADQKLAAKKYPEDGVVMELSLWLMHLNYPGTGTFSLIYTVAAVLRSLSQAPRLPALEWGAIIRRCMKYEGQTAEGELTPKRGILREECLHFSLAHAIQFNQLLSFLDELSDLSRFRTLELNLQSWIFSHLADLIKIFSGSRLDKLFDDVAKFLSSLLLENICHVEQKSLLRVSCWKGLSFCMDETSLDTQEYVSKMENCLEVLFSSLPLLQSAALLGMEQMHSVEWCEAIRCLAKARQGWLYEILQVSEGNLLEGDGDLSEIVKKIQAGARLVQIGSFSLSELGKLKAYMLNTGTDVVWNVLVEVVNALQHVEGSIKRQWLVDVVEISCVTNYPSTALRFLGLLSGSWSKYMPLLIVDQQTVLGDLPVTLSSLLSDSSWGGVAESVALSLWASTERIYDWAMRIRRGDDSPSPQPVDSSENHMADFLLLVMHQACVSLKDYLPPEKQLRLANLVLPSIL